MAFIASPVAAYGFVAAPAVTYVAPTLVYEPLVVAAPALVAAPAFVAAPAAILF